VTPARNTDQSDFRSIFGPLWARKWLIAIVAIVAAVGTYMYYNRQPRVYSSSTELFLGKTSDAALGDTVNLSAAEGDRDLANKATLIRSRRIGALVAKKLHSNAPPEAFTNVVSASPLAGSDFLRISVLSGNPTTAAVIANAFAEVFVEDSLNTQRNSLRAAISQARLQIARTNGTDRESERARQVIQRRIDELDTLLAVARPSAEQIDHAEPNGIPLQPKPKRSAIFGFFVGLVSASALAFVLSRVEHRKLRYVDDVENVFGVPLLTVVPHVRKPRAEFDPHTPPPDALREPLRRLDTTLSLLEPSNDGAAAVPRVILVTSAEPGDGKSTLVRNLALIQREGGKRVLVLDSDLRAPTQERLLNVQRAPGFSDVLASTTALRSALQEAPVPVGAGVSDGGRGNGGPAGVTVLAAGHPAPNPPALMTGPRLSAVIDELREEFDQVLIDSPPPLAVSDVLPLLSKVDGIILVCRLNHTSTRAVDKLMELLERLPNAPVLGVVANDAPAEGLQSYAYGA
jgi:capsular exopolysaccharide synthesis family protein